MLFGNDPLIVTPRLTQRGSRVSVGWINIQLTTHLNIDLLIEVIRYRVASENISHRTSGSGSVSISPAAGSESR